MDRNLICSTTAPNLIFSKNEARVELILGRPDPAVNAFAFDKLKAQKTLLESKFGDSLEWLELPNRKQCRVQFSQQYDGYDHSNWDDMIAWMIKHIGRLERAFHQPLQEINALLKQGQWQQLEEAVNEFHELGFQIERDQPLV